MAFINLEDEFPKEHGLYKVNIQRENGPVELAMAMFDKNGFKLTTDKLGPGDYIFEWTFPQS